MPATMNPAATGQPVMPPHVLVVGSGPAGLAAAETLATSGVRVTIAEHMPSAGRKLLMAGRGGLNLTHSEPLEQFLFRYRPISPAVETAIRAFTPDDLRAWAEGLGQPTFVGSSGRIFPRAIKASPLLRAWLARLFGLGVTLELRTEWIGWTPEGQPILRRNGVTPAAFRADATILALGGASWPRLGTDGKWQDIFKAAGIATVPLTPSNAGVRILWSSIFLDRHEGAPLKRISVAFGAQHQRGEALVTRQGLEGGAIYPLSSAIGAAIANGATARIALDLSPDVSTDVLAARLASAGRKQSLANILRKAAKLSPAAASIAREGADGPLPHDPAALASRLKAVILPVEGVSGLDRAISSAGGVAMSAVDPHFMLLNRPGTFVAGEMLDWDAPTGGYLLQASIATGKAAARGVLHRLGLSEPGENAALGSADLGV
ncbi:MAG: TIGR03862 family flavoprotein [Hyphomicrobium sp.]|nr:TIGR03862 family flavoprotein [Hyphomicrobium sp.]